MDRKKKYGAGGDGRKKTVLKKAEELCTLSGFRVFVGVSDGIDGSTTVWPPVGYERFIESYRLRRDIHSYQISKEPKRKMHPESVSSTVTFPPLKMDLLRSCEAELMHRVKVFDEEFIHVLSSQNMPSPGPPLMDHTTDHTSDYHAALDAYANHHGMDASEVLSEFDYVIGWCFTSAVDDICNDGSELLLDDGMGWCFEDPDVPDIL